MQNTISIKSYTHCQHDLSLLMLTSRLCLSNFSIVKLLFSSSFHRVLWQRKSLCVAPTWRLVNYAPSPWEQNNDINYLWFFCPGDLSILLCFLIYSIIYTTVNSWMSIIIGIIIQSVFSCSKFSQLCSMGAFPVGFYVPFLYSHCYEAFPLFFFGGGGITLLLFGTTTCPRLILYISFTSSRISYFSKEP